MNGATASPREILGTEDLAVHIGARTLIEALTLRVHAGEIWSLLGPNGCGKSTLLHVLAGLHPPAAGTVRLIGRALPGLAPREAARLRGLLLQTQSDAFDARVRDVVSLGRHPYIGRFGWESDVDRAAVQHAMHAMDVLHLADRRMHRLSGGERQRVAVATLLAQDTPLLLLDEPTIHLDLSHQAMLMTRLVSMAHERQCAIVFATHEYNLAARFATHALLIHGASEVDIGPADTMLTAERLARLFGFPMVALRNGAPPVFVPQW